MASVTLPLIDPNNNGADNHLKNLTYIVRKPKGANAPPRASKLTRERFSIFVANGDISGDVPFPNIAVSCLAQSSENEIKSLENKGSSLSIGSQQSMTNSTDGGGKNSLISVSLLKIKGLGALGGGQIKDEQITTVRNLFKNNASTHSLLNGELDADDDIWDDFNDSEKLKNNLEVLLTCKKMNLNFEVARNINVPGMLVIPKFHCQRCFEAWLRDCDVPKDCTNPEDPVRGAPIALDERAHIFLKDQNVSYIEIRGSQTNINKRMRNVALTSSLLRNKLLANRDSRNDFSPRNQSGTNSSLGQSSRSRNQTRPSSEARAIPIDNDEKVPASPRGDQDQASGITDVLIKSGAAADAADGIRRYGGLTNSQARVFVNSSLLNAEAGPASGDQKHGISTSSQSNITGSGREQKSQASNYTGSSGAKKKPSRETLNGKSGGAGGKRSKRNRGGRNRGGKNGSKTNLPDSGGETSKTSVNDGEGSLSSPGGRNNAAGPNSKTLGKLNDSQAKAPIAQSVILGMDLDEASGAAVKQERKKPALKSKQGEKRDSQQSQQSSRGGSRRNSTSSQQQLQLGQNYKVQGEGNNLQLRQESTRRLSQGSNGAGSRRGSSSNPLGLGFTQSTNFQQQQRQQRGNDDSDEIKDDQATPSKMQVRMRRDSFPGSASYNSMRRPSSLDDGTNEGGAGVRGGKRQIVLKQKMRTDKGELPPVGNKAPPSDLFKGMSERVGSGGSLSGDSRPSSRSSHSRCFKDQCDSKGDLIVNSSHAGLDRSSKNKYYGAQPSKKRNIFFASRFNKYRKNSQGNEVTPSVNALRTPSPPLTFPKCDLVALKMMSMTSRSSFSYYQNVPAQYKKHNEFVRNRALNVGKRSTKSPRKKR